MSPDKNQQSTTQTDQNTSETVSNPNTSQHRPNWIIPDNGISSNTSNRSGEQQRSQPDNTNIPADNDETIGIP